MKIANMVNHGVAKGSQYILDFSSLSDGSLPSGWLGSTWTVVSGRTRNNPSLGSDLVVNGGFETGSPPSSWNAQGSPTVTQVVDNRTGSAGTHAINIARGSNTQSQVQNRSDRTVGQWYLMNGWGKNINVSGGTNISQYDGVNQFNSGSGSTSTSWTQLAVAARWLGGATNTINLRAQGSSGQQCRYDDVSLCQETIPSLFSVRKFNHPYGVVKATWETIATVCGCPMGVVMCADYPTFQNFVIAYHDNSGNIKMDKCVNGTYTNLLSVATTYSPGKSIMLKRLPNTNIFQVWYGIHGLETQVGTDQTISDTSIIGNTYHGLFDTSPQINKCGRFSFSMPNLSMGNTVFAFDGENQAISQGKFYVINNTWGSAGAQSTSYSQSVSVNRSADPFVISGVFNWSWPLGTGTVKCYPAFIFGDAYWVTGGPIITDAHLPQQLNALNTYTATFDTTVETTADATFNTSFDIWVCSSSTPVIGNRTYEIMVHCNYQHPWFNTVSPNLGFNTIDGVEYAVQQSGGPYPALQLIDFAVRPTALRPTATVNITSILQWLIANGYMINTEYLADIEFGNEIRFGTGKTTIHNYSMTVT